MLIKSDIINIHEVIFDKGQMYINILLLIYLAPIILFVYLIFFM